MNIVQGFQRERYDWGLGLSLNFSPSYQGTHEKYPWVINFYVSLLIFSYWFNIEGNHPRH